MNKLNPFIDQFVTDLGATVYAGMVVEPFANDQLKDNLNPVGRAYYAFSTLLCTPCSRSQEVGLCLGAQAGETRIREVVTSAGFKRFRRATETLFNIVYEDRDVSLNYARKSEMESRVTAPVMPARYAKSDRVGQENRMLRRSLFKVSCGREAVCETL
jgi:hypothetical protein